ncbi:MAG: DUF3188 domain-containing protein [Synechococcaceae cyanobacterium]|nr:DUF3188 domain-containing protein [Synechococcaceae cyanobacterium]
MTSSGAAGPSGEEPRACPLPLAVPPPPPALASRRRAALLALATPLLLLLALATLLLHGSAALQALPALLIGVGLLLHSWLSRRRRRRELLRALRQERRAGTRPPA